MKIDEVTEWVIANIRPAYVRAGGEVAADFDTKYPVVGRILERVVLAVGHCSEFWSFVKAPDSVGSMHDDVDLDKLTALVSALGIIIHANIHTPACRSEPTANLVMTQFLEEIKSQKLQALRSQAKETIFSGAPHAYREVDGELYYPPVVVNCIHILSNYASQTIMNDTRKERGDIISLAESIGNQLGLQPIAGVNAENLAVRTIQAVYSEQTAQKIRQLVTETGVTFPDSYITALTDHTRRLITDEGTNLLILATISPTDLAKGILWVAANSWPHNTLEALQREGSNYTVQKFNRMCLFTEQAGVREEISAHFISFYREAGFTHPSQIRHWQALHTYTEELLLRTGGNVEIISEYFARGLMELATSSPLALQRTMDQMPLDEAQRIVTRLQGNGEKIAKYVRYRAAREEMILLIPPFHRTQRTEETIQMIVESGMPRETAHILTEVLFDELAGNEPYAANATTLLGKVRSRLDAVATPPAPLPSRVVTAVPLLRVRSAPNVVVTNGNGIRGSGGSATALAFPSLSIGSART